MALTIKQRYDMLDLGKLPNNLSVEFRNIKENTENFSDPDLIEVFDENFDSAWDIVEKKHPEAIRAKKKIKVVVPATKKVIKAKVKKKIKVKPKKAVKKPKKKIKVKAKPKAKPMDKVAECKKVIQEAGYTIKKSIVAKKRVTKKVKRPDSTILKEDVSKAIVTITKDTVKTKESRDKYSESFKTLNSIKRLLTNLIQGIDRLYNSNDSGKLKKIEALLKDIS